MTVLPRCTRDGRVQLPTTWSLLASQIEQGDNAQQLAKLVLETAECQTAGLRGRGSAALPVCESETP